MARMDDAERREFLLHGTRTGHLAVTREDGQPHVTPVWFVLDGDDIVFTTAKEGLKGRCLARDGRAGLSVDDAAPPYSFVVVRGSVELSDDPAAKRTWATRIAARYMGEAQAEAFGERNSGDDEWLCRLTPERTIAEAAISAW